MSMSCPSAPAKTDLETVVNWPLLITATGMGFLLLAVPALLACIATIKGDAVKDKGAVRPTVERVNLAPVAAPVRPIASQVRSEEGATPLPVYVEGGRPAIKSRRVVKVAPVVAAPPPAPNPLLQVPEVEVSSSKRFDLLPEEDLLRELAVQAKEVDLESVKGTRDKLLPKKSEPAAATARRARRGKVEIKWTPVDLKSSSLLLALRADRPDLRGLPMLGESDCQAGGETAIKRQAISSELRTLLDSRTRSFSTEGPYRNRSLDDVLTKQDKWFEDEGLSTVVQMMQTEGPLVRRQLVERLARVQTVTSSTFLARIALFDFSSNVRERAGEALKYRRPERYRQVLLEGLRYPWAPVAAHAAETLVAIEDRGAAFSLAALLDEPDPRAPVRDKDNKWVVREVVSVNHLRNCLLCHPPSTAATDPLRGIVPTPGQRLPVLYYSSEKGDFVRADVTYLRQDFSLMQRVAKPDKWPEWQRFDYMVRTRELTADEQAARTKKPPKSEPASYPQRNAVLFALRELTGLDAGEESADWYELLWATTP